MAIISTLPPLTQAAIFFVAIVSVLGVVVFGSVLFELGWHWLQQLQRDSDRKDLQASVSLLAKEREARDRRRLNAMVESGRPRW